MIDQGKLWWRVLIKTLLLVGIAAFVQAFWVTLEVAAYGAPRPSSVDTVVGLALAEVVFKKDETMEKQKVAHEDCEGCAYEKIRGTEYPCSVCSMAFPSRYEPKPRFTQEEVVMAKMLAGIGYVALARDADHELNAFKRDPVWEGSEWMSTAPVGCIDWDNVPSGLFLSCLPGQAVSLEEVVGDRK